MFVADERDERGPDASELELGRWAALAEGVLVAEGVSGDAELSVLFIDEGEIAELNARFMATNGSTDVLSFPIDTDAAEPGRWPDGGTDGPDRVATEGDELPLLLGDVVIAPAVARRNAPDHAGRFEDEIALLIVHGVLHVLGLDHADENERTAMQARERELLAELHGPLAADPWAAVNHETGGG